MTKFKRDRITFFVHPQSGEYIATASDGRKVYPADTWQPPIATPVYVDLVELTPYKYLAYPASERWEVELDTGLVTFYSKDLDIPTRYMNIHRAATHPIVPEDVKLYIKRTFGCPKCGKIHIKTPTYGQCYDCWLKENPDALPALGRTGIA